MVEFCFLIAVFGFGFSTFLAMDRGAPPNVFFPRAIMTVLAVGAWFASLAFN